MAGKRNRAATRAKVVAAAIEVFAERGYSGASIESIAEASGMTIGALYSNFSGKRELFLFALREAVGRSEEEPGTGGFDPQTELPADRLVSDGIAYMNAIEKDPARFRLLLWSLLQAQTDADIREVVVEVLREQRDVQASILKSMAKQEDLILSPKDGATLLNAMAIGFTVQRMVDPRKVTRAEGRRILGSVVAALPA